MKCHPGDYAAPDLRTNTIDEYLAVIPTCVAPNIKGVAPLRCLWKDIETAPGVFGGIPKIVAMVAAGATAGLQIGIMPMWKSFSNTVNPCPTDLQGAAFSGLVNAGAIGITAYMWDPVVRDRYKAMLAALGAALDTLPYFEGIALEECSMGAPATYSGTAWADALTDIGVYAAGTCFRRSQIFWYQNYIEGNPIQGERSSADLVGKVRKSFVPYKNIVVMVPDTINHFGLQFNVYPRLRTAHKDQQRTGMCFQNTTYKKQYNSGTGGTVDNSPSGWTIAQARDYSHVSGYGSYRFWNKVEYTTPYKYSTDVLPVIAAMPECVLNFYPNNYHVKRIRVASPGSTGNQTIAHGLKNGPFKTKPKDARFVESRPSTNDQNVAYGNLVIGLSDFTHHFIHGTRADNANGLGASKAGRVGKAGSIVATIDPVGGTFSGEATFVSIDETNLIINWTTLPQVSGQYVDIVLRGGVDMDVAVRNFSLTTRDTPVSVTDLPFVPNEVEAYCTNQTLNNTPSNDLYYSMGYYYNDGLSTKKHGFARKYEGTNPTNAAGQMMTSKVCGVVDSTGTLLWDLDVLPTSIAVNPGIDHPYDIMTGVNFGGLTLTPRGGNANCDVTVVAIRTPPIVALNMVQLPAAIGDFDDTTPGHIPRYIDQNATGHTALDTPQVAGEAGTHAIQLLTPEDRYCTNITYKDGDTVNVISRSVNADKTLVLRNHTNTGELYRADGFTRILNGYRTTYSAVPGTPTYALQHSIKETNIDWLTDPLITTVTNQTLGILASINQTGRRYSVAWNTNDIVSDDDRITSALVILGQDPTGADATSFQFDTSLPSGLDRTLTHSGLSTSPVWWFAEVATDIDENPILQPVIFEQMLAAPAGRQRKRIASLTTALTDQFSAADVGGVLDVDLVTAAGHAITINDDNTLSLDQVIPGDSYTVRFWQYASRSYLTNVSVTNPVQVPVPPIAQAFGKIIISRLIDEIFTALNDARPGIRWTIAELLDYLNDGQRDIATIKQNAYVKTSVIDLAAGTMQAAPEDVIGFVRPVRNIDPLTEAPGRAIQRVDYDQQQIYDPDWHHDTQVTEVERYMSMEDDYKIFFVSPPSDGNGKIEIRYPALPPEIATEDDLAVIPDSYRNALFFYALARANLKEIPEASAAKSAQYFSLYRSALGLSAVAETTQKDKKPTS